MEVSMFVFPKTQDSTHYTAAATAATVSVIGAGATYKAASSILSKQKLLAVAFAALALTGANFALGSYNARMGCGETTTREDFFNKVLKDATLTRFSQGVAIANKAEEVIKSYMNPPRQA